MALGRVDPERSIVTLPAGTLLDLGATAKAWAVDRICDAIWRQLGGGALVSLGGDLAVRGAPEGGFDVGIADICGDPAAPIAVAISTGGLATSGIGNRHWLLGGTPVHHLVDPSTGLPADTHWKTVSVAAALVPGCQYGFDRGDGQRPASGRTGSRGSGSPPGWCGRMARSSGWRDGRLTPPRRRHPPGGSAAMTIPSSAMLASAQSSKALWYLTRSTGLVALVLLTATVVVGVVASVGWTSERWPRFLSQDVHRNLSLFCVGFVAIHVVTTVSDGYVPIGFADAFIPFRTAYRPLWVGLGALTFDLLLAVLLTSALRHRIGFASWRFVHWLAYLCWPVAMFHGLGSGSDSSRSVVLVVDVLCAGAVLAVVAWRLAAGRTFSATQRALGAAVAVTLAIAIAVFAVVGPLRPGWSRRAGTSAALLAELAKKAGAGPAGAASAGRRPRPRSRERRARAPRVASGAVPTPPFTVGVSGTQTATGSGGGQAQVTLSLQLQDASSTPLTVVLTGTALRGGGVSLSSGTVSLGSDSGTVTGLNGGTINAIVSAPNSLQLVISLNVDQNTGALSGTVTGTAGQRSDR